MSDETKKEEPAKALWGNTLEEPAEAPAAPAVPAAAPAADATAKEPAATEPTDVKEVTSKLEEASVKSDAKDEEGGDSIHGIPTKHSKYIAKSLHADALPVKAFSGLHPGDESAEVCKRKEKSQLLLDTRFLHRLKSLAAKALTYQFIKRQRPLKNLECK